MKVFSHSDVKAEEADEGALGLKVRWLITKEIGAENFAMRLFEMAADGHSPYHSHPWEHEVFVLEGEGAIVGEDGERKFKKGDVVFVSPDEKHQFRNAGKAPLKFLCIVPNVKK